MPERGRPRPPQRPGASEAGCGRGRPRSCAWQRTCTGGWKSLPGGASRQTTESNCVPAMRRGEQLKVNRSSLEQRHRKRAATRTRYGLMRLTSLRAVSEVRRTADSPESESGAKSAWNWKHGQDGGAWGGWRGKDWTCRGVNQGDLAWSWKEQARSQSPHSSEEAGNDRGAKGGRKVDS